MPRLNWGLISDGGAFESLLHAILYAQDPGTILFGRPGKDAGQDARTDDGTVVYQAKYRQALDMDGAITIALSELEKIKKYRESAHANFQHWQNSQRWILAANFSLNPNDEAKWQKQVAPAYQQAGLSAEYWGIERLEGSLTEHPEVSDVFFGGQNRVLVGLKEAYDLLSAECVGSLSLDVAMVGRNAELDQVGAFAESGETRVLPLIGPGGIGKSRLLYESLVSLSQGGWRVLWGLPGTMARSSQWFRLLNGTQQTCVALDDPDDPNLLRALIEQLSAVERRNWRIIIACRSEKADSLRRYRTNRYFNSELYLSTLDEAASHALVNSCLGAIANPSWLHSVYRFTRGVPGWLCLIAELTKQKRLPELPSNADGVASIYVDSCLESVGQEREEQGLALLRWMALWGTLRIQLQDDETVVGFLESEGIPKNTFRELLETLAGTGIVRNWGIGKRLYAVEPLIVRQHILSQWLLRDNAGSQEVSLDGAELVSRLLAGEVPLLDSILHTLSHLSRSRLPDAGAVLFLGPVFDAMVEAAATADLLTQHRIAELVNKVGAADPEGALDVLIAIRKNVTDSTDLDLSPWGPRTATHKSLMADIPWTLFQVATQVVDQSVARRYIEEFEQLIALEDTGNMSSGAGKGPRQLLKRLLCDANHSDAYGQPAYDMALTRMSSSAGWPFVCLLAECLMDPIRESMEWAASWTLTISRRAILPASRDWDLATSLRANIIRILQSDPKVELRSQLWQVLAESHQLHNRAMLHGNVKADFVASYRALLIDDLKHCVQILNSPPDNLTIEEATRAREIWKWYLQYGKDDDIVALARRCEQKYNAHYPWRLHDFFRFDTESELAPEIERVTKLLRDASSPVLFAEFFDEAQRYLTAARPSGKDMADDWRISELADALANEVDLCNVGANPISTYVANVLGQPQTQNPIAWGFAVRMCRQHLLRIKEADQTTFDNQLDYCLKLAAAKDRLLWWLYSNVHPRSTGQLNRAELEAILAQEGQFAPREFFFLLGAFVTLHPDEVQARLRGKLDALRNDLGEASQCLGNFIGAAHLTALRYEWAQADVPVRWIIQMIVEFQLNGALLGMYDLESLRDRAGFRLNMREFVQLMQSRIELESGPRPTDRFEIVPSEFSVGTWCDFNANTPEEVDAFREFCRMALSPSFTALYWMPKYIAQLDPAGKHVVTFVSQYLAENPGIDGSELARLAYLAEAYPQESNSWADIAGVICAKAQLMRRDDRDRVYFGLSQKESGVMTSMPGEVPDYYVRVRETAASLLANEQANSPLYGYRQWSLRRAEEDLRREEQSAEEDGDG